jgi:SAM-dependent methyltransferase
MAEEARGQVSRYILDGSDQDLRRLLIIAELNAEAARTAFRRVGVQQGWNAIDCGCGPLGGLAVLAEMVGPAGRVVGVDLSHAAAERARAVVAALELGNVEVVAGDLHELDSAALGGPFDLAYTRLFLMHQADPVRTLRHIADLLRPGGWLVAQEPLDSPPPRSHPHLEALTDYWDLHCELRRRAGVPAGVVEDLPRSARQAGLEVTATYGSFMVNDPELQFEIYAATLAATRERGIQLGVAAERIDDLVRDLRAAKGGGYEWVTSPFFLGLALRKPAAGRQPDVMDGIAGNAGSGDGP